MTSPQTLRRRLNSLHKQFMTDEYVSNDPLGEVYEFKTPADREVAAFVCAGFAFGNIKSILSHLEKIWLRTGMDIAHFTRNYIFQPDAAPFTELKYRWISPSATSALFHILGEMLRTSATIEEFFKRQQNKRIFDSLDSFCRRAIELMPSQLKNSDVRGVRYFFTSPKKGGACKRINLFLRWMVRKEAPDLGLWSCLLPADLVIPLDIHVARVSAGLGLTARRTKDWKMAQEITDSLRKIDPDDPLKYDFAMHKMGVQAEYKSKS